MRVITLVDKHNVEHELIDEVNPELWAKAEPDMHGEDSWFYQGQVTYFSRQDNRALLCVTTQRGPDLPDSKAWHVFWYIGTKVRK